MSKIKSKDRHGKKAKEIPQEKQIHGTVIRFRGKGVLIMGKSGMGKSDLALRLLEKGARVVADDVVHLEVREDKLYAFAPPALRNKLEVRGFGIIEVDGLPETQIDMVLSLQKKYDRLPKPHFFEFREIKVPEYVLSAFEDSILLKIRVIIDRL